MPRAAKIALPPWQTRIVGYGEHLVTEILANERNWRIGWEA